MHRHEEAIPINGRRALELCRWLLLQLLPEMSFPHY
jgi:hypothetical protein